MLAALSIAAELSTRTTPARAQAPGPAVCSASAAPKIGRLGLQKVVSDPSLVGLTDALQAPDSDDWYLVEQRGRVLISRAGRLSVFLDLSSEIALRTAGYEDRGLVSIAFAPDYARSGTFYVSVTPTLGADQNRDLLLAYTRSASDRGVADPGSRRTLVSVESTLRSSDFLANIHNGGRVAFGPDGMLYLAMGDGGGVNCGDAEPDATQNLNSLFGKLLRLDPSQPPPHAARDNPFVGEGDPRVLHYGLRNPFRFSWDRATGDLYIGDVGQNRYEEVDFAPRGARGLNFGWPAYEGDSRESCPARQLRPGSTHTAPIFVTDRRASANGPFRDWNASIGGVVYRGTALPALTGVYLTGGYQGRRLAAFYHCGDTTSPVTPVNKRCDANAPAEACFRSLDGAPQFGELRAIVEDHAGELYVVTNGNSLLKIVPAQ